MEPALVWGIVARLFYVMLFIFFVSLTPQLPALGGPRGISPVKELLDHIGKEVVSPLMRFKMMPSFFWMIDATEATLLGSGCLGAMSSLLAALGGVWSSYCAVISWICAISLSSSLSDWLIYPWDSLLFEMAFLMFLLPAMPPVWEELALVQPPIACVAFAFHFLYVRLLVGFGKCKFKCKWLKGNNIAGVKCFLMSQPLPSAVGCVMYHLPAVIHALLLFGMFFAEMLLPWAALFPWPLGRQLTACVTILLMVSIQLAGNFGHFNMLTIVLAFGVFDLDTYLSKEVINFSNYDFGDRARTIVSIFHFLLALIYWSSNSWTSSVWPFCPHVQERWRNPVAKLVLGVIRMLAPFHLAHGYGIFPEESLPPFRFGLTIMGTDDGETWQEYKFKYHMPDARPRNFAPHHPRIDQHAYYTAHAIDLPSAFSWQNPYSTSRQCWLDRFAQRLMEPSSPVKDMLASVPMYQDSTAPTQIRITRTLYQPTEVCEMFKGSFLEESVMMPSSTLVSSSLDPAVFRLPTTISLHWQLLAWQELVGCKELTIALEALRMQQPGQELIQSCENLFGCSIVHNFWSLFSKRPIMDVVESPNDWALMRLFALALYLRVREDWIDGEIPVTFGSLGNMIFFTITRGKDVYMDAMSGGTTYLRRFMDAKSDVVAVAACGRKEHMSVGLVHSTGHGSFGVVKADWHVHFWDALDKIPNK